VCGRPLTLMDRVFGRAECSNDRSAVSATRERARSRYLSAIAGFDLRSDLTPAERQTLTDADLASIGEAWHHRVATSAVMFVLDQALETSVLRAADEDRVAESAALAKVDLPALLQSRAGMSEQLVVARANDGRLPLVARPTIRLRRREVCFFEARATLMTASAGAAGVGHPGVSAPKCVVLAGQTIAHLPALDSQLRPWDDGMLLVTDQRVFFEGDHVSIQVPHRRLIGFQLFRDGVRIRIAARRAEPILRVAQPALVAAIANSAWTKSTEEALPRFYAVESFEALPVRMAGSSKSG
jgi:hypothetical protein